MSASSPWQVRVREYLLAYIQDAAVSESGGLAAAQIDSVLQTLFQAPDELALLRQAYFIMGQWDLVERFIRRTVPQLVRSLTRASGLDVRELEGRVEGSVDWGLTTAARATGAPATRYVCVNPVTHYGTPENQALVWVLHSLAAAGEAVLKAVRGAARDDGHPDQELAARLGDRSLFLYRHARRWLTHVHLRSIPAPRRLEALQRNRLAHARDPLYREVARVVAAIEHGAVLTDVLRETILLPPSPDTLFELYVLMEVVRALPAGEGWRVERRIIWAGRKAVARAVHAASGRKVEVFYNQAVLGGGVYEQVFSAYDLEVGRRRPDITVKMTGPGKQVRYVLVEVKRTTDKGYIVDSVYKVLGYLQDFAAELGEKVFPQAVLAVEGGIRQVGPAQGPVVILTAEQLGEGAVAGVLDGA